MQVHLEVLKIEKKKGSYLKKLKHTDFFYLEMDLSIAKDVKDVNQRSMCRLKVLQ